MKKTLLVVDDDRVVAESLRKLLEGEGFEVLVAVNAQEAIECFSHQRTDLVVLDINLGNDSGWTVFQALEEINPLVPTVVITAEWGQRDRAVAAGAEALIEKPIDVPSFLELIRNLLVETAEGRLERSRNKPEYCRYVAKEYTTFLRLLQERRTTPLDLSSEISAALPTTWSRTGTRRRMFSSQTVVGDPTTGET